MDKSSLTTNVSLKTGLSRKASRMVIEAALEAIAQELARGEPVVLQGFGTFLPQKRAARIGRNPHTREPVPIPACIKPKFKASRELEAVVGKLKEGGGR